MIHAHVYVDSVPPLAIRQNGKVYIYMCVLYELINRILPASLILRCLVQCLMTIASGLTRGSSAT